MSLSLQRSCHLFESHLGTWLATDALGMKEVVTSILRMRIGVSLQVCNSLYKSPKDRFGQTRVHILGCVPHSCPRNPLPHSLFGADNLYVNNNVNGHLIHQADNIHIPLGYCKSPQMPLCQPLLTDPVFVSVVAPLPAVIFLHTERPRPEKKMFNGQICLW